MPRTTRKELIERADRALRQVNNLDLILMDMDLIAAGRQPEITKRKAVLVQGHEALRTLWQDLRNQL